MTGWVLDLTLRVIYDIQIVQKARTALCSSLLSCRELRLLSRRVYVIEPSVHSKRFEHRTLHATDYKKKERVHSQYGFLAL